MKSMRSKSKKRSYYLFDLKPYNALLMNTYKYITVGLTYNALKLKRCTFH